MVKAISLAMDLLADSPAPSFDDPLGMLRACHSRIARQLAMLEGLARHLPEHGADASAQGAARAILRYFDTAAPHHDADEEVSVFPRLVAHVPSSRHLLARLASEHGRICAAWRRLRPLLAGIASGQRANLPPVLVRVFSDAYDTHMNREDETLLPMCADELGSEELAAIGAEMAARRGVPWRRGQRDALIASARA